MIAGKEMAVVVLGLLLCATGCTGKSKLTTGGSTSGADAAQDGQSHDLDTGSGGDARVDADAGDTSGTPSGDVGDSDAGSVDTGGSGHDDAGSGHNPNDGGGTNDTGSTCTPPSCCTSHDDCTAPNTCQPDNTCGDQPGPVYDVRHGGIADHGDPDVTGSLAWRLKYVSAGQTVRLVDNATYSTESTIAVPQGVTLEGGAGATLQSGMGLRGAVLMRLAGATTLENLVIDGARRSNHLIEANRVNDVRITGCTVKNTRNDWPSGSDPRCHGILLIEVDNAVVEQNTIENMGYPKVNPRAWPGICAGIHAERNTDLTVHNNTVRNVLTGGIDFTGSTNVHITDNTISRTGRNIEYWQTDYDLPVADGITAYSNGNGFTYQAIYVERNSISDSGNHGIHLSGRDLHVNDNTIDTVYAHGILIDDHRPPADCASNVFIERNTIRNLRPEPNRHAIYIGRDHKRAAFRIANNTPQDIYWRPNSTCE